MDVFNAIFALKTTSRQIWMSKFIKFMNFFGSELQLYSYVFTSLWKILEIFSGWITSTSWNGSSNGCFRLVDQTSVTQAKYLNEACWNLNKSADDSFLDFPLPNEISLKDDSNLVLFSLSVHEPDIFQERERVSC